MGALGADGAAVKLGSSASLPAQETISQLTEYTKAAITTRGLYYPPGKQPKEGERKLHLLIEGTSMAVVDKAVNEIKRLLTEATAAAMERGGDRALGGRYSVV